MVGLIDIVPLVERVNVRGHEVEVRGINVMQLGLLIWQSSDFRRLAETNRLDLEAIIGLGAPIIAKLITASCADRFTEESASNLSPGEQAEILAKIIKVNAPSGLGPFVEVMDLLGRLGVPEAPAFSTNSGTRSLNSEPTAIPTQ